VGAAVPEGPEAASLSGCVGLVNTGCMAVLAPRQAITLTTFRKQRQAERWEVARARKALRADQETRRH
jgi:hypothetical protein